MRGQQRGLASVRCTRRGGGGGKGEEEAKELGRISSRPMIYPESFRARIAGSNRKAAKLRLSAFIAARILKSF